MIDIDVLYFEWLLTCLDSEGALEGVAFVGDLLHNCDFKRRVGNDINRAVDGANLRKEFLTQFEDLELDPRLTNDFMMKECSWFEMLVALARALDFLYEGGVEGRFIELVKNMALGPMLRHGPDRSVRMRNYDQQTVYIATDDIDGNRFTKDGHGGLFPLHKVGHSDQREAEIWDQHAAYFHERLEGVLF